MLTLIRISLLLFLFSFSSCGQSRVYNEYALTSEDCIEEFQEAYIKNSSITKSGQISKADYGVVVIGDIITSALKFESQGKAFCYYNEYFIEEKKGFADCSVLEENYMINRSAEIFIEACYSKDDLLYKRFLLPFGEVRVNY